MRGIPYVALHWAGHALFYVLALALTTGVGYWLWGLPALLVFDADHLIARRRVPLADPTYAVRRGVALPFHNIRIFALLGALLPVAWLFGAMPLCAVYAAGLSHLSFDLLSDFIAAAALGVGGRRVISNWTRRAKLL